MEHPLIANLDNLTVDQLQERITELNKKLAIAYRTGNGYLCDQLRMALESYQTKYREKLEANYRKQTGGRDFDNKIDIK